MMLVSLLLSSSVLQVGEVVTTQTLGEFFEAGGPVMYPLGLMSVVAVAFIMERYLRLRRGKICPKRTSEALDMVRQGRIEEARRHTEANHSPAGRILLAGLRRHRFTLDEVERTMEDQGQKEMQRLMGPIRPISIIANVAPLLGLLGTVMGIAEAFNRVVKTGMGKPENLAAGIEEALTTTIAGLLIAIPAMLLAAHLTGRVRKLMLHTDEQVSSVVELLARQPGERSDAA